MGDVEQRSSRTQLGCLGHLIERGLGGGQTLVGWLISSSVCTVEGGSTIARGKAEPPRVCTDLGMQLSNWLTIYLNVCSHSGREGAKRLVTEQARG
jgi:hypothetical protein